MKIAAVQMDVAFADSEKNLQKISTYARQAAGEGAKLIVFPECAITGYCYSSKNEAMDAALLRDGAEVGHLKKLATELDANIICGMLTKSGQDLFNSLALVHRNGDVDWYFKTHVLVLGVDRFVTPGSQPLEPFDVDGVKVGLSICYDGSFPESSRVLTLRGADIIVLPTNWPSTSGCTADFVPNTRAMENHVYFAAVNRVGTERGFTFIGKSRIVAPGGKTLQLADDHSECILYDTIDPKLARNKLLVNVPGEHEVHRLLDRRPDLYGPIVEPK
jgi:5-aminopentanamidase